MGSHRKWRAVAKKMRRKKIRQKFAQERDRILHKEQERKENSPRYQVWLSEQKALELFAEEEEARLSAERHAEWELEEARAQKVWRERQERLALARAERAKQELRIREEWEEEQRKLKATKEEQERIAQEKQLKQDEVMRQIENFINKGYDMPPEVNIASMTNPDRPPCPFFTKTGACRFGDRCSRNHIRPAISRVLLVSNFYDHIGLRQMNHDELEAADDWLEYEDSETYHHFLDFYEDVLPEWERMGKISQFKVCCNFEPHLRGNVYIEYESAQDAVRAFKSFHGRFYGGRQINVEFVTIDGWKAAICGQFHKHCCPKGRACNFLHVFRNPGNAFHAADRDHQDWRRKQKENSLSPHRGRDRSWSNSPERTTRPRDWRWSASPSPPPEHKRSHRGERDSYTPSKRKSRRRKDGSHRDKHRSSSIERPSAKKLKSDSYTHRERNSRSASLQVARDGDFVGQRRYATNVEKKDSRRSKTSQSVDLVAGDSTSKSETGSVLDSWRTQHHGDSKENFSANDKMDDSLPSDQESQAEFIIDSDKASVSSKEKVRKKDKKSKKKKDSHRKEKRRKKKHRGSSEHSSSSDSKK